MGCNSCSRRRAAKNASKVYDVMGGHKYLPDKQIRSRLEVFKKRYCSECSKRYSCDFEKYSLCKDKII